MGMLARAAEEGKDDGKRSSESSFVESSPDDEGVEDIDSGGEGMHTDADSIPFH